MSELKLPIYLDYQATTPIDPRVLDKMMPFLTNEFGNPHSVEHNFGWKAEAAIDVDKPLDHNQVEKILECRDANLGALGVPAE